LYFTTSRGVEGCRGRGVELARGVEDEVSSWCRGLVSRCRGVEARAQRVNRKRGFPIVTRSRASVTLHLAPSGRGTDLDPCAGRPSLSTPVRTGGARCGASKTHPPPIGVRPSFERPPGAPRGLLMAACAQVGFDRPRLGGRVVPVADAFCSPLGVGQHPKTAPRRHTALPASLFLLLRAVL